MSSSTNKDARTGQRRTDARRLVVRDLAHAALLFALVCLVPLAFLAICVFAFNKLAWVIAVARSFIGGTGWVVLAAVGVLFAYELRKSRKDDASEALTEGGGGDGQEGRGGSKWAFGLSVSLAAIIVCGNLCLNIAAARVDKFWESRKQQGVDIYKSHDLAKLVGQCVRLAILRHAQTVADSPQRKALESIAAIAPRKWLALTEARDQRVAALADARLIQFIRQPDALALHQAHWVSLLGDWRLEAHAEDVDSQTLAAAASTVAVDFGITLRETLKADFESGGRAWASLQLDIAQTLLNKTSVADGEGNPAIKSALVEVRGLLESDATGLPALRRTLLMVRQTQDDHARMVARNFDQIAAVLQRIQVDIAEIKTDVKVLASDVKITRHAAEGAQQGVSDLKTQISTNDDLPEAFDKSGQSILSGKYMRRARRRIAEADLAGAERDADRAIDEDSPSMVYGFSWRMEAIELRADIRMARGDLRGAKSDLSAYISKRRSDPSLNWFQKAGPYETGAELLRLEGALKEAEESIDAIIARYKKENPEYKPGRSHAVRARILCDLKKYDDALESIGLALDSKPTLFDSSSMRDFVDERAVASWRGDRAVILLEIGRLEEAQADSTACITWLRENSAGNHARLARGLRDHARILSRAGQWSQAKSRIAESVRLYEQLCGGEHEWTRKARVWQAAIEKETAPPRWLETVP